MTEITTEPLAPHQENTPDEDAKFIMSSTVKITDPNTGEVLLHQRAD